MGTWVQCDGITSRRLYMGPMQLVVFYVRIRDSRLTAEIT